MTQLNEVKDKIADFEREVVERLATIEEYVKHLVTKAEIADILADKARPDWAGRTKFIAALLGSGGLGVAVVKIIESLIGGS